MCVPVGKFVGIRKADDVHGAYALERFPLRCNRWACDDCGPRKCKRFFARSLNGAIAQPVDGFRPQYSHKLLTLTCPGREYREANSPQTALKAMAHCFAKLVKALQKRYGAKFLYLRVVEFQQDGFPHYHVLLAGGVIAPKGVLADIRRLWTDLYGMGNVDIQKNRSGKVKGMVRYLLKYLTKSPASLPKRMRLYTCSKGAMAPVRRSAPKEWIASGVYCRRFEPVEQHSVTHADDLYDFIPQDAEARRLLIHHFHAESRPRPWRAAPPATVQ